MGNSSKFERWEHRRLQSVPLVSLSTCLVNSREDYCWLGNNGQTHRFFDSLEWLIPEPSYHLCAFHPVIGFLWVAQDLAFSALLRDSDPQLLPCSSGHVTSMVRTGGLVHYAGKRTDSALSLTTKCIMHQDQLGARKPKKWAPSSKSLFSMQQAPGMVLCGRWAWYKLVSCLTRGIIALRVPAC